MVKSKVTKKFAAVKRLYDPTKDQKIKQEQKEKDKKRKDLLVKTLPNKIKINEVEAEPSHMFFKYNTALGPPYRLLLDTNFLNFSIQNKLDIFKASMDCLLGKCIPCITDCVVAELEKLGHKYRLALRLTKDPRFRKLKCDHTGTYADDCIASRVKQDRVYIVATCDKDLKRRIRKIPGVPIMSIGNHKYAIERLPGQFGSTK